MVILSSGTVTDPTAERHIGLRWLALVLFAIGLAIVLFDVADGAAYVADIDDQMRELQIRALLAPAGQWFDLTIPGISTPDSYISPWSRLVDLPYFAIVSALQPLAGLEHALRIAFAVWPLCMLAMFAVLVAMTIRPSFAKNRFSPIQGWIVVGAMMLLMLIAVDEFSPGRIDHHNVQILTMVTIAYGLVRWDRLGGVLIGIASGLSLLVGLECLPFILVAFAGLVLVYLLTGRRTVMVASALAVVVTVVVGGAAFVGPAGLSATQCDAFSAPYLFLVAGSCGLLAIVALLLPKGTTAYFKGLCLALPALCMLVAAAWLFPACLDGPYRMIDPLSQTLWLNRVAQEHSVLYFYEQSQYVIIAMLALQAAVLVAAFPSVAGQGRAAPGTAILYALAIASFVLTLLLIRYIRFPAVFVPLMLPLAIHWFRTREGSGAAKWLVGAAAAVGICAFAGLAVAVPAKEMEPDAVDFMALTTCAGEDFSVLENAPPGIIIAPLGLSLPLLSAIPGGYSVAAVPFHRAAPGINRVFAAFTSQSSDTRRAALAPFDYVAVCRLPVEMDQTVAPMYAALAAGGEWPGLVPVASSVKSQFQLFLIDHAMLQ